MVAWSEHMITQQNYLDFWHLIVNEIIGSATLFIILGFILLGYLGVRFRLPLEVLVMLCFIFSGIITAYAYNAMLWGLSLIVAGILFYGVFSKIARR